MPSTVWLVALPLGLLFVLFVFAAIYASRYVKVGPNEVLIVSGRKRRMPDARGVERIVGFRVVKGGGTFVFPVLEKAEVLSLELFFNDTATTEIYTSTGVPV